MGQNASTEDSWSSTDEAVGDGAEGAIGAPCVRGAYAEWKRKGKQPIRPKVGHASARVLR